MDNKPRSVINLLRGWPSTSLLPAGLIRDAANAVLSDPTISNPGLLYGPDEGYQPCREAIAQWLTSFHQPEHPITPDRLCITGGASQNLGVMMGVYSDPHYTRNIWIVTPAYMLTFRMFEDAGFHHRMRAVPEDEEGIDIEYLRREICKSEEEAQRRGNTSPEYKPRRDRAKVYRHVIYCVPNFSNPSSRTMTLSRRRALVKLAREYDALITCDDVYDLLQWPASANAGASGITLDSMKTAHLPRLVDIDRELDGGAEREGADGFGNVQSNGTCSKIAGPGLRTGWVEGTPKFVYGLSQA
jgi:DNA-binding transcriptional MocR family regulator